MSKLTTSFVIAGAVIGFYYIGKYACQKALTKKAKEPEAKPAQAPVVEEQPAAAEEKPVAEPVVTSEPVVEEEPAAEEQPVAEPVEQAAAVVVEEPVAEEPVVAEPTATEAVEPVVEPAPASAATTTPVVDQEPTLTEEPESWVARANRENEAALAQEQAVIDEQLNESNKEQEKVDAKFEARLNKTWFDQQFNKSGRKVKWDPEWVVDNDYQDALFHQMPEGTKKFHSTSSTGTKLIWTRELGGKEIDTEYPVILFWDKSIGKLCVSFFHNVAKEPRCFEFDTFASVKKFLTPIES